MYLLETCLSTSWNRHSTPWYVLLNMVPFGCTSLWETVDILAKNVYTVADSLYNCDNYIGPEVDSSSVNRSFIKNQWLYTIISNTDVNKYQTSTNLSFLNSKLRFTNLSFVSILATSAPHLSEPSEKNFLHKALHGSHQASVVILMSKLHVIDVNYINSNM